MITYGPGGYDPSKPDNNVVAIIEDPVQSPEPDLLDVANAAETIDDIKAVLTQMLTREGP